MDANMQLTINSFRQLFPDKIFSPTLPWLLVKSLTFPWQCQMPTFPGFPDKWSPCDLSNSAIFNYLERTQLVQLISHVTATSSAASDCLQKRQVQGACQKFRGVRKHILTLKIPLNILLNPKHVNLMKNRWPMWIWSTCWTQFRVTQLPNIEFTNAIIQL